MNIRLFFSVIPVFLLMMCPAAGAGETETFSGRFSIIWGDAFPENPDSQERFFLTSDAAITELLLSAEVMERAGGVLGLNGKEVVISAAPNSFSKGGNSHIPLVVDNISLLHQPVENEEFSSTSQAIAGPQPWISVMCEFPDVAGQPRDLSYFQNMYSSSYPGLDHYWREASYDIANVSGSGATGWYTLPQPRSYYVYNNKLDFTRITNDCTAVADAFVFFPDYVGINLMFNGDLDGYAWGGSRTSTIDGQTKTYRVTWEPPWGYKDITVIAHEMGHGFGMPHSSGNYGQTYDNVWDVMSSAWANCQAADHPTYGCLGQHTIAYHRDRVGWIAASKKFIFSGTQAILFLESLTQPTVQARLMAQIPIKGSTTHYYTVEVRKLVGYDTKLVSEAVIIHEVDLFRTRPAYVIDIDNNGDTGDAGAIWKVGETFTDAANDVCVEITGKTSSGYTVKIGCQASPPDPPLSSTQTMVPMNYLLLR